MRHFKRDAPWRDSWIENVVPDATGSVIELRRSVVGIGNTRLRIRIRTDPLANAIPQSESQEAEYLTVLPVAGTRGGFGGGIVLRQPPFDISIGYQRHWNLGLDNRGNGRLRASAGSRSDGTEFNVNSEPRDQQFKTFHVVNGGSVSQSADLFTFGTTIRF